MSESRRSLLRRAGWLVGGLVGAGTVGTLTAVSSSERSRSNATEATVLYGRDWHIGSRELAAGQLPQIGQRMLVSGTLFAQPDGREPIGEFAGSYVSMNEDGRFGALASLEQHVLTLSDGSIIGVGRTGAGLTSEDEFAVVGGTGRYAGARGSYVIRQSHTEFGGDGTATIALSLQAEAL